MVNLRRVTSAHRVVAEDGLLGAPRAGPGAIALLARALAGPAGHPHVHPMHRSHSVQRYEVRLELCDSESSCRSVSNSSGLGFPVTFGHIPLQPESATFRPDQI